MKSAHLHAAVAAAALSLAAAPSARAVEVALAGPITGDLASFGEQLVKGAELAVEDLNAAGGVLGEPLNLHLGDDRCDPKEAVNVANKLVNDGVVFVAGHFCSGSSIPASEVYWEEGVLQISPASTNPQLTENGRSNVFRTCGRDDQQGDVAGAWLHGRFPSNVAVVHDKSAYGKGVADFTKDFYESLGGEVTLYEAINAGEQDYSALVTRLKNEGVEAVYFGGYHSELGLIARQAAGQDYSPTFVGADSLNTLELWSITGDAGEGVLFTFAPDPRFLPQASAVVERFRDDLNYEPEGYTLYTYAAFQAWAEAAETAGSFDVDAVSDALRAGQFETVLGEIAFDEKGDRSVADYTWYEWSDGNYSDVGANPAP